MARLDIDGFISVEMLLEKIREVLLMWLAGGDCCEESLVWGAKLVLSLRGCDWPMKGSLVSSPDGNLSNELLGEVILFAFGNGESWLSPPPPLEKLSLDALEGKWTFGLLLLLLLDNKGGILGILESFKFGLGCNLGRFVCCCCCGWSNDGFFAFGVILLITLNLRLDVCAERPEFACGFVSFDDDSESESKSSSE